MVTFAIDAALYAAALGVAPVSAEAALGVAPVLAEAALGVTLCDIPAMGGGCSVC